MDTRIPNWLANSAPEWFLDFIRMSPNKDDWGALHWDFVSDRPVLVCTHHLAKLVIYSQQAGNLTDLIVAVRYDGKAMNFKDAEAYSPKRQRD